MEVKADVINTLRECVRGSLKSGTAREDALAFLDRLSPPEPEQPDEAMVWAEKIFNKAGYFFTPAHSKIAEAAGVLSELLASKDAENERLQSELAALRAENERLKNDALQKSHGARIVCDMKMPPYEFQKPTIGGSMSVRAKAAERNPAEPVFTDTPSILAERALGQIPAPDTAPVVEVTEADRDAAKALLAQQELRYHKDGTFRDWDNTVQFLTNIRTEAEARGRREALEAATARLEWYRQYGAGMIDQRGFAASLIGELKRLMTEVK